jgi:hypothetical protein
MAALFFTSKFQVSGSRLFFELTGPQKSLQIPYCGSTLITAHVTAGDAIMKNSIAR